MEEELKTYDGFQIGDTYPAFDYVVTEKVVRDYLAAVQDSNPYYEEHKIVPASLAAVYTRWAMFTGEAAVPGTIHAKQTYQYLKPIPWGSHLKIQGTISDKYIKREHKYVVKEAKVYDETGALVAVSKMTVILPR